MSKDTRPDFQLGVTDARLSMYRLPGDPPLTERDVTRYMRSNAMLRGIDLGNLVKDGLMDTNPIIRRLSVINLGTVQQDERLSLLQQSSTDVDPSVRRLAVLTVGVIPEVERKTVIQRAQTDEDRFVRQAAASKIGVAPEEERLSLFQHAFSDEDPFVRANAVAKIKVIPSEKDRIFYIQEAINDPSVVVRRIVSAQLEATPPISQTSLEIGQLTNYVGHGSAVALYEDHEKPFLREPFEKTGS